MHETSCVNVSFKFFYINIRRILECKQSKEKDLELPQVVLAETEWSEIFATIYTSDSTQIEICFWRKKIKQQRNRSESSV
jgi:hypothetical protein